MPLTRRTFLKGMVAGAAGLLLPSDVAAEPERRIWPGWSPKMNRIWIEPGMEYGVTIERSGLLKLDVIILDGELMVVKYISNGWVTLIRGQGGTAVDQRPIYGRSHRIQRVGFYHDGALVG